MKKENITPNILLQGGQIGVDYKINFYIMITKLESLSSGKFKKITKNQLRTILGGDSSATSVDKQIMINGKLEDTATDTAYYDEWHRIKKIDWTDHEGNAHSFTYTDC